MRTIPSNLTRLALVLGCTVAVAGCAIGGRGRTPTGPVYAASDVSVPARLISCDSYVPTGNSYNRAVITVSYVVSETGVVTAPTVVRGSSYLSTNDPFVEAAAISAARGCLYTPAMKGAEAVAVRLSRGFTVPLTPQQAAQRQREEIEGRPTDKTTEDPSGKPPQP